MQHRKSTKHQKTNNNTQMTEVIKLFIYHTTTKMYTLQRCSQEILKKERAAFFNCTGSSNRKSEGSRGAGGQNETRPFCGQGSELGVK